MSDFVHLHNHSEYSLLDGLSKIKPMIKHVKDIGQKAVAVTDHGNMYGTIKFYQEAKAQGIKPIIGCEIYVSKRSRHDKEAGIDNEYNHLILLAKNETGYKNLMKIVSVANLEGFYYKPRTDLELLKKYHEGLICLTACVNGYVSEPMTGRKDKEGEKRAKQLLDVFGPENLFFELQRHTNVPNQEEINQKLIALSRKLGVGLVATNDNHYTKKDDAKAQEVLLCIQTQTTIDTPNRKLSMIDSPDFYIKSANEMAILFADIPEAVENTVKIAKMCNVEIELGKWHMPVFEVPDNKTAKDYLREIVQDGLKLRYNPVTKEIQKRIDYELDIIFKKGYETYFLVVSDFVNWAKDHGIAVGPGRGSAAGSVVSYALRITDVDPFFFSLPFERFLNPLRPSAPDIDLDFADIRRDEVIRYVTDKYGEDKVAQIITFGTMEAKGAVRDAGRALGYPYAIPDRISKMIPPGWQGHAMTLDNAIEQNPELKKAYQTEEDTKKILDAAKKLEGVSRHASVHAAGVVIADKPITEYTPLQRETNGDKVVTQYDMYTVGEDGVGLLKMDFLGLRNLTIIEEALRFIKESKGQEINLNKLPLDDKKTYALLASGETTGIFQLESSGMRKNIKELKPTTIFDLQAMVALYRPGPMAVIPEYVKRKHNPKLISYPHPKLESILKESYGVLTYQDDVLLTAITLAGYSWLDADKFRKAMGKKIPAEMKKQQELFIEGAVKNGLTLKQAKEIFELIAPFAGYGFNKCLSGDTVVADSNTGLQYTIKELYQLRMQPKLLSLTENYNLQPESVTAIQENGQKKIYEVVTRRGLTIKATDNHPFLTINGFSELKNLKPGDKIGTARKASLPIKAYPVANSHLAVLGYLLAEGNFCHPSGVYFYSTLDEEINDFVSHAKHFKNVRISINSSKSAKSVYIGREKGGKANKLFKWVKKLNLHSKKAAQKKIPKFVFQLNQQQLALLLAKMWQGDGCINTKTDKQIFYATSSKDIAYQMQHLLLRLNILSAVYIKSFNYRGTQVPSYTIYISRYDNIKAFADSIGRHLIGSKKDILLSMLGNYPILNGKIAKVSARGTNDIFPVESLPLIRIEIYKSYESLLQSSSETGMSLRLLGNDTNKNGLLRETGLHMADCTNSNPLKDIGNSDVYWDEIVAIIPRGKEMTYDLTINETHNFVANDFIVHNSHAACYATIAYRTAYLKANYPVEFMTALLTAESRGTTGPAKNEKIAQAILECKRLGLEVLPPDINKSEKEFTIEDDTRIRFGLSAIKNVGEAAINAILSVRKNGDFASLEDFCNRIDLSTVNKKTMESLIKAGTMDTFNNRANLLIEYPEISGKISKKKKEEKQASLFGENDGLKASKNAVNVEDFSQHEKLAFEKELLGFYLTSHPQNKALSYIKKIITHELMSLEDEKAESRIKIGGIVESSKKILTKKTASEMAFVTISDETGSVVECVVFPKVYEMYKQHLTPDKVIIIDGKLDMKNEQPTVIAEKIFAIDQSLIDVPKN